MTFCKCGCLREISKLLGYLSGYVLFMPCNILIINIVCVRPSHQFKVLENPRTLIKPATSGLSYVLPPIHIHNFIRYNTTNWCFMP